MTIVVTACASADHSWRGEFDARLEGAAAAVEEASETLRPTSTETEIFETSLDFSPKLFFKSELIDELDPPDGCQKVQERRWNSSSAKPQSARPDEAGRQIRV